MNTKCAYILLLLLGLAPCCAGRSTVLLPFVTHVEELQEGLSGYEEYPICVQVGSGFFCAPIRAHLRCMTPLLNRPGYYDKHVDQTIPCTPVVVLRDTSRAEPSDVELAR